MTPSRPRLGTPTLAERLSADHRTRYPDGDLVIDPAQTARTRHVHVRLPGGPTREGLVLEWARSAKDCTWSARVIYVIDDPYGNSRVVEEWLRAGMLLPIRAPASRPPTAAPSKVDDSPGT